MKTLSLISLAIILLTGSSFRPVFTYHSDWKLTSWMDKEGVIQKAPEGKIEFTSFGVFTFYPEGGKKFHVSANDFKWMKLHDGNGEQFVVPLPRNGEGSPAIGVQVVSWNDKYMFTYYMATESTSSYVYDYKGNKVEVIGVPTEKDYTKKINPLFPDCSMKEIMANRGILPATTTEPCGGSKTKEDLIKYFEER